MLSPIILLIATILYFIVHSLTASNHSKTLTRKWFGSGADRWYRLVYNLWAGISFSPILWLLWVLPDKTLYKIPIPWVFLTTGIQLIGVAIILIGILQTGALSFFGIQQLTGTKGSPDSPLITNGLYAFTRHPLYTGGLLIIWATPVMSINILTLFIIFSAYLVVGAGFEEKRMVFAFGDKYRKYQTKVPMLIPRISKNKATTNND
jgi:protein-S-isoprenylcysteine O-methyltransferase Ste14